MHPSIREAGLAATALATQRVEPLDRRALGLIPPTLCFVLALSWRASPTLKLLNLASAFLLVSLAVARAHGMSLWRAALSEQVARLVRLGLHGMAGALTFVKARVPLPSIAAPFGVRTADRAILGILIALPLLLVFDFAVSSRK